MVRRAGRVLVDGATDHPWVTLLLVAAVTLAAGAGLVDLDEGGLRLRIDPGIDRLLPEHDADRAVYDDMRQEFGNDEALTVAVVADDVFTPAVLRAIGRMTTRFAEVPGVRRVTSLATALDVRSSEGELVIEPFLEHVPETPAGLARLRRAALDNPMYAGTLVSHDGTATALRIDLEPMNEVELARRGIDRQLETIAQEERGPARAWMTGTALVKLETSRTLVHDLARVVPAALAVALLVAFLAFRTLRGVLIPAATILLGLVWTLGMIGWSGHPLNLVTTIVPPLILTIGFAYSVHVLAAYYEVARHHTGTDGRAIVREALAEVRLPMMLTALTTAVGFAALIVSSLIAVREFGVFAVLGVSATAVASLAVPPALLTVLPVPRRRAAAPAGGPVDRLLERLARFDIRRRTGILVATALVSIVAAWGVTRMHVGSDIIKSFPAGAPVRRNFEAVNQSLGGAHAFYIVLESEERDAFKKPSNLRQIEALEAWLEEQPLVGGVISLADHLKLLNWALHDEDPSQRVLPNRVALVDQLVFFGASKELESLVDRQFRTTRILVRTRTGDTGPLNELLGAIDARLATMPPGLSGNPTGSIVLVAKTMDDLARGQVESLTIAFAAILVVLSLILASVRMGLIALVPNAVPVLVYFGTMGLTGVPLSAVTGLVACIVIGIAVDDTIHYITRFSVLARERADETAGTVETLRSIGRPVTYTSVALCLGFLTLTLSTLRSQVQFGALSAFTLGVAWLLDMTLTPALCSRLRFVTLWDVLTLDLGEDPQGSIPLFAGLRPAQARAVALMTNLRAYAKGDVLFRQGQQGDEFYAVIDGELAVWVERDGQRLELTRLRRGDVVGEIALFRGRRSANVDVLEDAHVLALRQADLERLRARYPRVAAVVYRNLGEILAGRVTSLTDRVSGEPRLDPVPLAG